MDWMHNFLYPKDSRPPDEVARHLVLISGQDSKLCGALGRALLLHQLRQLAGLIFSSDAELTAPQGTENSSRYAGRSRVP